MSACTEIIESPVWRRTFGDFHLGVDYLSRRSGFYGWAGLGMGFKQTRSTTLRFASFASAGVSAGQTAFPARDGALGAQFADLSRSFFSAPFEPVFEHVA